MTTKESNIIWEGIWQKLEQGVNDRNSPYRSFTLSYLAPENFPEACTVVLRQAEITKQKIAFHTDARSQKFAALRQCPQVTALFYDPLGKIQLRLQGLAEVHHLNNKAKKYWENSYDLSKQCYRQIQKSGEIYQATEDLIALEPAFENFAVIEIELKKIDYLFLHVKGHIRYIFQLSGRSFEALRVAP